MLEKTNYGGISAEYDNPETAPIVVLPVPYDGTSTWNKGADKGPDAILEASNHMELYDIKTAGEIYRKGIFTAEAVTVEGDPEVMVDAVYEQIKFFLAKDKFVVTLGGEHSVSIGAFKAHAEKYTDLTVVQLDAHADLRISYEGSSCNHACVMARAKELCPIVQVGIRSMDISELPLVDTSNLFYADDIRRNSLWIESAVRRMTDNIYVTIDLDVFDPSIMPSTGTPEPGGLSWYEVIDFLEVLADKRTIIGFDVVELCPAETNKAPDFLASKLIYQLLGFIFSKRA